MRRFRKSKPQTAEDATIAPLPTTDSPAIPATASGTNLASSHESVSGSGIDPNADVTLAEITHLRVADLRVGDTLLSFGDPEGPHTQLPWRLFNFNAVVTRITPRRDEALHFFFDDGRHLTTSANHRFVSSDKWVLARDLVAGSEVPVAMFAAGPEGNAVGWGGACKVTAIEPLGMLDLIDLETSTGTFFAIGLAVGC